MGENDCPEDLRFWCCILLPCIGRPKPPAGILCTNILLFPSMLPNIIQYFFFFREQQVWECSGFFLPLPLSCANSVPRLFCVFFPGGWIRIYGCKGTGTLDREISWKQTCLLSERPNSIRKMCHFVTRVHTVAWTVFHGGETSFGRIMVLGHSKILSAAPNQFPICATKHLPAKEIRGRGLLWCLW